MNKKICSEVYAVLMILGQNYIARIPSEFWAFLQQNHDSKHLPNLHKNKPLQEQGLSQEAHGIIAMMHLNYWCNTDEEKAELLNLLKTNDQELNKKMETVTSTRELMRLLKRRK